MIPQESMLVVLVKLLDRIPTPPVGPAQRGRPITYPEKLFLKALVIMIVKHLQRVHELLSVLQEPTFEMEQLRNLLTEHGRYPSRRTWERRLKGLPASLPTQIGCFGRYLVSLIAPWATCGRAVALDSTVLRSKGGVWHKKDREKGEVPHSSIDTQAHWTKSGWHGWVYGWKLHIASVVAAVWIPLSAQLTSANVADNEIAPALIYELPPEARFVLGDLHYHARKVQTVCEQTGRILVTPRYGPYPHTDPGVEVRRIFHKLRSLAIENFNQHFKGIFDGHGQVPTKGLINTQRFALGAIFVYQLALLYRFQHGLDLNIGLKAFIKAI
ncbi:MAG TPA: transposase [Anaerolineales bacterium]|nr:transposase [Anaerolineales bacterium]